MALTRRQREMLDFIAEFIRTKRYSPSLEEIAAHFGLSSVATVHKHVSNLERKGFIKRSWNRSRSIDLVTTDLPGAGRMPGAGPAGGLAAGLMVAESPAAFRAARAAPSPGAAMVATAFAGAVESVRGASALGDDDIPAVMRLPLLGRVAAGRPIEAVRDDESIAVPAAMIGRHRSYVLQVKGDSMIGDHISDGDFVIVEERATARDGEKVIAMIGDGEVTLKTFHRESDGSIRLDPSNPSMEPIRIRDGNLRIQGVVIGVMRKYRA
jgi:repressor LexA